MESSLHQLERVQKYGLRMCSKQWNAGYTDVLSLFKIPTLSDRREYLSLCTMFKITQEMMYFPIMCLCLNCQITCIPPATHFTLLLKVMPFCTLLFPFLPMHKYYQKRSTRVRPMSFCPSSFIDYQWQYCLELLQINARLMKKITISCFKRLSCLEAFMNLSVEVYSA